jgi:hypothetical protein
MAAALVSISTVLVCAHGGTARPVRPSVRVRLGGQPAVATDAPCTVAGCPLPAEAGGPCVSAQWLAGALRVRLDGVPALLADSRSVCTPTGAPLSVLPGQTRVIGG